jgi:hypothetical protein
MCGVRWSCLPLGLALYCLFSTLFSQIILDYCSHSTDQPCRLITTLFLLVLHFYDYMQFVAPPSTFMTRDVLLSVVLAARGGH